jgi:hypothetical protein
MYARHYAEILWESQGMGRKILPNNEFIKKTAARVSPYG